MYRFNDAIKGPKDCKSNLTDYYEEYHFIIVNLILLIEGSWEMNQLRYGL